MASENPILPSVKSKNTNSCDELMRASRTLLWPALMLVLAFWGIPVSAGEMVKLKLSDGEMLTGKLELPADSSHIQRLIVYIPGTGPRTYLTRRKIGNLEFNYYDLFTQELTKRGVAFFTYNKRGCDVGDTPPNYETIDREKFAKVVPSREVPDLNSVIAFLKADKRLREAKIALLGWSEGTILAAMAAEQNKDVEALLLAGYVNDNLFDVIKWQNSGASSMVNLRRYFRPNRDQVITREEYESTSAEAATGRKALRGASFEQLDRNKDGKLTAEDFAILNGPRYARIMEAVQKNDDEWIWNNYFHVTTAWLNAHFKLEPNKTRLLRLTIPIFIFHGDEDGDTSVEGVYDIRSRFADAKKANLHCFVFKHHDHDLYYMEWPLKKVISEGLQKLFETSAAF
ncbi:MAG: alpha/beta fold hydrolase [Verrucomicrobiota bacterium]